MTILRLERVKRIRTGDRCQLAFELPEHLRKQATGLIRTVEKDTDGRYVVEIKKWYKRRSTGPHSMNHHINGHIQQIAIETGNDFDTLKTWIKRKSISEGYPMDMMPDNDMEPRSESSLNTVEAAILIETIHRIASELGIQLVEESS